MAAQQKPALVIVGGAWHPAAMYGGLAKGLEDAGFEVVVPKLPTVGDNGHKTWKDDREAILAVAKPFFDAGREVSVVAHSWGGIPAVEAVTGYQVQDRQKEGKKGGFKSIAYISAFCLQKGVDLYHAVNKNYLPCTVSKEAYMEVRRPGGGQIAPSQPQERLLTILILALRNVLHGGRCELLLQ
jgi:pimeloyl-ACP methyl ester carboxylesterase